MGTPDPRLDAHGKRFKILSNLFRAHAKDDPPPERVKPIPMQLVEHAVHSLRNDTTLPTQLRYAIADCIIIGYFFLLRPGEFVCATGDDNHTANEKHPYAKNYMHLIFCLTIHIAPISPHSFISVAFLTHNFLNNFATHFGCFLE